MFSTYNFQKLLVETSNFDDLPEQWLKVRAGLVPYVARAHRFAVDVSRDGWENKAKTGEVKEYPDYRLSASIFRKANRTPSFAAIEAMPKVSVAFEPVRKSLGQFTYDYDPLPLRITIRFFLTENIFILVQAGGDEFWGDMRLQEFTKVDKLTGFKKHYFPSPVPAKSFIS